MDYKKANDQLQSVQLEIRKNIPNYWQGRIDKMIDLTPKPMKDLGLFLYAPKDVVDLVGCDYKGINLIQINPSLDIMYLSNTNIFLN
jgi:hypothetical protein